MSCTSTKLLFLPSPLPATGPASLFPSEAIPEWASRFESFFRFRRENSDMYDFSDKTSSAASRLLFYEEEENED